MATYVVNVDFELEAYNEADAKELVIDECVGLVGSAYKIEIKSVSEVV